MIIGTNLAQPLFRVLVRQVLSQPRVTVIDTLDPLPLSFVTFSDESRLETIFVHPVSRAEREIWQTGSEGRGISGILRVQVTLDAASESRVDRLKKDRIAHARMLFSVRGIGIAVLLVA